MSLAAPTLFDILLQVYDDLGELKHGIATGGSSTGLVDSGLGGSDDDWNGGTVFVVEADAAAPEGEFAEVTNYTASTGTLTVPSSGINAISASPVSGDEYALASKDYPLDTMRSYANRALSKMFVPSVDESLTTAASTKEYTIPAVANDTMRRVYIAQTSTASNEGWVEMFNWRHEANVLIFREQPPTSKTIKIVYLSAHTRLAANSDALSAYVPLQRIVAETVYLATVARVRSTSGDSSANLKMQLNELKEERDDARRRWPILDPGKPYHPILSGKRGSNRRRRAAYGPWIQS